MRVLLTNDDGIHAEGLQTLRRALLDVEDSSWRSSRRTPTAPRRRARSPRGARCGSRRSTSATAPSASRPTDAGGLRALRDARADRGLRGRVPHRLGHQPRRQPRRRHHLLRRLAALEASSWGYPGHRRLPAVGGGRARLQLRRELRLLDAPPRFTARLVEESRTSPLPSGTLLNINCRAEDVRRRGRAAGQAVYRDELTLVDEDRPGPQAVPDLTRRRHRLRGRGGNRPGGCRGGQDRRDPDPLRPHRPQGMDALAAYDLARLVRPAAEEMDP